ncbi:hypothetical protein E1176_08030 [Fulvivirga sp. RKSG066]|uniref:hypothetical protein n=1 Tax=Fulvivirga aurantia TaxID=2529383 RepID=UPI0012BD1DE1|nr:hypothetical protein [Fulvivirga aurantia]MTI20967.1 hypothetical protein [Fulvivirga aurantia]
MNIKETKAIALTRNSFNIPGRGVVVELQHYQQGLEKGTLLTSEYSGLSWKVKARILFDHAEGKQVIFKNESTEYLLLRFNNSQKRGQSLEVIKKKESNNIFHYYLKPIEHSNKPPDREKLTIDSQDI